MDYIDVLRKLAEDKKCLIAYNENPCAELWEKIKHLRVVDPATGKTESLKKKHKIHTD